MFVLWTTLGIHVDVYGGTRHSNIMKALVYQSCHVCKWPIYTVDVSEVEDIRENFIPEIMTHPLVKTYPMQSAAIVIAIDGEAYLQDIPDMYHTVVVIGRNDTIHNIRSWESRLATVHFFPTNVYRTPFTSGFNVQCDPHVLAHASLLALLL